MPFPFAGVVNSATPSGVTEFVFGSMATQQTTNITGGTDHLKFDTVIASRGGSAALDTTTAYSSTAAAASIGRITLKAGRTYRLQADMPYVLFSGATGLVSMRWYDATGSANIPGIEFEVLSATQAEHEIGAGRAMAVFTPGADSLVELRLITTTALLQLGITTANQPSFFIETM